MVYSYSGKFDRRYPYYICLNAQRKGWAVCPAKSLPARHIEDSVLAHVQAQQLTPIKWEQLDAVQRVAAIRGLSKESASKAQLGGSPSAFIRPQSRESGYERKPGSHFCARP